MERWLSKPRVLIALSVVLLSAALNRRDPLVYGIFLFLVVLVALAFALPWASLRRVTLRAAGTGELVEGDTSSLMLLVEQRGWWPVFMVDVQTCWEWAGHEIVLRHVVPVLRRGRPQDLGERIRFPCRGHYRLREVRLGSSFPLGLFEARHRFNGLDAAFVVRPRPSVVEIPGDLPVSSDERGLQVTRRLGNSQELGTLRDYELGDPIKRMHWRASARAGRLIVQQPLQSGSPLLRVVVQIPGADQAGQPESPGEQAIRAAAGLCRRALADGLRVRAYLAGEAAPLASIDEIDHALAVAAPGSLPLPRELGRASADIQDGDLLVVVVAASSAQDALLPALDGCGLATHRIRVYAAAQATPDSGVAASETTLAGALAAAGIAAWPDAR